MREEAQASGERYERGVSVTARATHPAFGFAFFRVMHRADLTGSDARTAFGLLVVIRRRTAGRHRHDGHGGELARKPDDGDRPQQTCRTHGHRYFTESATSYARRNHALGRFRAIGAVALDCSRIVRQAACLLARKRLRPCQRAQARSASRTRGISEREWGPART